ncbi:hypothetical protein HAHE_15220 [Haloferula helveola]|uniref:SH3 domain-containing protein n=1 Tax=Haloferula helveola TaxID=490095 RepID=A0ABM7R8Z7_9BACT|nr:hypothetical protein HAHE_15220 [Haloferula helveola]
MNIRLISLPVLGLMLAACEQGGPISSGYDPLDTAGGGGSSARVVDSGYRPGEFIKASMDSTGFFKKRPDGDANADKLLKAGTPMKVIMDDGSFVKVELDSGELGYVSTVQVMGENEAAMTPYGDGEVQVWPPPPSDGIIPLDQIEEGDPDVPVVPTEIDPDAPADVPLLPSEPATDGAPEVPPLPEPPPVDAGEDDSAAAE